MRNQSLKVKHVKVNGYSLLNIRLVWYTVAFVHLVVTAAVTLNIDVTGDEDPLVRAYSRTRWKLITCLFNIIALVYLPLCLYCDWWEKRGEEPPHVEPLRELRDVVMTSILMPVTTFADVTFWMLFNSHAHIMAPPRVFEYVPNWAQHSLHTISMVTVIVDLLLTPRRRTENLKPGLILMLGLVSAYYLMVYVYLLKGEAVYAVLATASNTLLVAVYISIIVVLTILYYMQWHLIDYIWGEKKLVKNS